MSQSSDFHVMVGNGEKLECTGACSQVPVILISAQFSIHFFVLPISGANIVLGVQWLKTLGPIVTDYAKLNMQFEWQGNTINLQGIHAHSISQISSHHLKRMHSTKSTTKFYHLEIILLDNKDFTNLSTVPSLVFPLLQ